MKKHYVPKTEENKHTPSMSCSCKPRLEQRDGYTVAVHRSVTGLEQLHSAQRLLGLKPRSIVFVEINDTL